MDPILVTITGIALLLAVAMGLIVFKVLGDEQRRSDARVELLTRVAGVPIEEPAPARAAATTRPAPAALSPAGGSTGREAAGPDADVFRTDEGERGLFASEAQTSPWGTRVAAAAAVGVLVAVAGYGLLPGDGGNAGSPSATAPAPLELVALGHVQRPDGLTISGMVQNPAAGSPVLQVSAVAVLFGPDGALVATGRAAVDYPRIGPGEESPFVIDVPVSGTVARYRVGFRRADGSVLAHIDRRVDSSAARHERAAGGMRWDR
jgi:hypothetical protein